MRSENEEGTVANSAMTGHCTLTLFRLTGRRRLLSRVRRRLHTIGRMMAGGSSLGSMLGSPGLSVRGGGRVLGSTFTSIGAFMLGALVVLVRHRHRSRVSSITSRFVDLTGSGGKVTSTGMCAIHPLARTRGRTLSISFTTGIKGGSLHVSGVISAGLLNNVGLQVKGQVFSNDLHKGLRHLRHRLLNWSS